MTDLALTRRGALAAAGAATVPFIVPRSVLAATRRPAFAGSGTFPSGVASGSPGLRSATVWTRLGDMDRSAQIGLEVARDPDFKNVIDRRRLPAHAARDHTARARIQGDRLSPDERYWYRFFTRTTTSPVGRFKTARPADSREPVRIAFFSCQRYEHGFFTPQDGIAAEDDLDLVVSLGDYLYDQDSSPKVRNDDTGKPNDHAETLAQWRAKHRLYRSDERLQRMHAAHAFIPIWDDCEVEGNWAADEESASPGPERDPRQVPFLEKRRNAYQAFFEHMPLFRFASEQTRIYRSLRLGANAELLMLDTRQYRDPQPCEGGKPGRPCPDAEAPGRKRLGEQQKAWLKDRLVASDATWKVLGNAQMMMALDVPTGVPLETDSWNGYGAERREVLDHVVDRGVQNVTSIVGDVHVYFAGDLTTTGRAGGRPAGTEFVGASVSHDALAVSGDEQRDAVLTERVQQANPHLRYANFRHHGYAVLEARPDQLEVTFRAVRSVAERRSDTFTLERFLVDAGTPQVRTA